MSITYDITTSAGMVRLLIGDTADSGHLFSDAEISAFLSLGGDNVRLAAAQALEVIAANQVMVLKVISLNGLSADGASVARELRLQAASLRKQVEDGIGLSAAEVDAGFDWAEQPYQPFSSSEWLANQALRGLV